MTRRPPTAGASSTPEARSLFATTEIGAIVVVVSTTFMVTTTSTPPYGLSKHFRRERLGYCPCDNQPREWKSSAGREKDSNERTLVCHIARSDDDEGWFCEEGCEIAPRNNQQTIFHHIASTRAISRHSIARNPDMIDSIMSWLIYFGKLELTQREHDPSIFFRPVHCFS